MAGWALADLTSTLNFKKVAISVLLTLLLLPQALYFDFLLLTDIAKAPLPREERKGYLEDWTAGYGLKEIAQFLDAQSQKEDLVVGTEGAFGTLPDGLQIYLDKNRKVTVIGGGNQVSDQIKNTAFDHPTFFVANRSRYSSFEGNLELIREYPKAVGPLNPPDSILLFQVLPEKNATSSGKLR